MGQDMIESWLVEILQFSWYSDRIELVRGLVSRILLRVDREDQQHPNDLIEFMRIQGSSRSPRSSPTDRKLIGETCSFSYEHLPKSGPRFHSLAHLKRHCHGPGLSEGLSHLWKNHSTHICYFLVTCSPGLIFIPCVLAPNSNTILPLTIWLGVCFGHAIPCCHQGSKVLLLSPSRLNVHLHLCTPSSTRPLMPLIVIV